MRILFDQGTPAPLRTFLLGHEVHTAFEMGWAEVSNGRLLRAAEDARFDLMITTDQSIRYQQNLKERVISILVLPTTRWPDIRAHVSEVAIAVNNIRAGDYQELRW